MPSVREARRRLVSAFAAAGLDNAGLDALIMLETVLATRNLDPDAGLAPEQGEILARFARRRLAGEPTWRIIGERDFWGLTFRLSPATLEPRPDSEAIVEAALRQIGERRGEPLSLLDLGTGTGCRPNSPAPRASASTCRTKPARPPRAMQRAMAWATASISGRATGARA